MGVNFGSFLVRARLVRLLEGECGYWGEDGGVVGFGGGVLFDRGDLGLLAFGRSVLSFGGDCLHVDSFLDGLGLGLVAGGRGEVVFGDVWSEYCSYCSYCS